MGYYTQYGLTMEQVKGAPPFDKEALDAEIRRMNVFGDDGSVDYGFYAYDKWYEHEQDMLLLSARFPNALFTLEGDGEDSDDRWQDYYLGGRVMHGGIEIIYNAFDPAKLTGEAPADTGQPYSYER